MALATITDVTHGLQKLARNTVAFYSMQASVTSVSTSFFTMCYPYYFSLI